MLLVGSLEHLPIVAIEARVKPLTIFGLLLVGLKVREVLEFESAVPTPEALDLAIRFWRLICQHAEELPPESIYGQRIHGLNDKLRVVALRDLLAVQLLQGRHKLKNQER